MKTKIWIGLVIALFIATPSFARKKVDPQLSGWLEDMLAKVVVLAEQHINKSKSDKDTPVAVAGLRGSERKGEKMEPYWKGELSLRSPDVQLYQKMERLMQDGKYAKALGLSDQFKNKFSKSKLLPEVYFTRGLAYAGLGRSKKAVQAFNVLIKSFPQHELVDASKSGIARLKKA